MHSFSSYTNRVELGRGGMSTVYRATAPDGGTVALKALAIHLAADPTALRRFEVEIKLLSDLVHPNIVRLLDANLRGSPPFMVTEFVDGDSLDKIVTREGALSFKRVASILIDMGYALDYAHSRGIIHRDVKPGNILVRKSNGRALLADFGVAKSTELTAFTSTRARVGSVYYMSPEQIEGRLEITRVSDVYSLGITAYLALTGKHPYEGGSEITIAKQHLDAQPQHVSDVNPGVPRAVGDMVMKAIAKRTYQRFATAGEFARRFRDVVGVPADVAAVPAAGERAAPLERTAPRDGVSHSTPLPPIRPSRAAQRPTLAQQREDANVPPLPAQIPQRKPSNALTLPLASGLVVLLLCLGIVLIGSSVFGSIGLSGARAVLPRAIGELQSTALPTPILLDPGPLPNLPNSPTPNIRTIATDLAERAQGGEPNSVPTLDGALTPYEPVVVYEIITATPAPYNAPPLGPLATSTRMEPLPSPTAMPRPLPKPVHPGAPPHPDEPGHPKPPAPHRTPPPPPLPPLRSPLAIITAAP
jgi:eukaryotic-like serine/threonine-protein kinase